MVIFDCSDSLLEAELCHREVMRKMGFRGEFKFSKTSNQFREQYLVAMARCNFVVRSIVVDKSKIHSDYLRENKNKFYDFVLGQLIKHDHGVLNNAKIILDGSGSREFKNQVKAKVRKVISPHRLRDFKMKDSLAEPMLQLADAVVGATIRAKRGGLENTKFRKIICHRIQNEWNFR